MDIVITKQDEGATSLEIERSKQDIITTSETEIQSKEESIVAKDKEVNAGLKDETFNGCTAI